MNRRSLSKNLMRGASLSLLFGLLMVKLAACGGTQKFTILIDGPGLPMEIGGDFVGGENGCHVLGGKYDGLHTYSEAVIRDGSSKVLATEYLKENPESSDNDCQFLMEVDVSRSDFYQIEVNNHDAGVIDSDQISDGKVTLNLP